MAGLRDSHRRRYGGRGSLAQYLTSRNQILRKPSSGSPQLPRLNRASGQQSMTGKRAGPGAGFDVGKFNSLKGAAMAATVDAVTNRTHIKGVPRQGKGTFEDRYRMAAFERDRAQDAHNKEMGYFKSWEEMTPEQRAQQGGEHTVAETYGTGNNTFLRPTTVTEAYQQESSQVSTVASEESLRSEPGASPVTQPGSRPGPLGMWGRFTGWLDSDEDTE